MDLCLSRFSLVLFFIALVSNVKLVSSFLCSPLLSFPFRSLLSFAPCFLPLLPLALCFFFLCSPWLFTSFSFAPLGSSLLFPLLPLALRFFFRFAPLDSLLFFPLLPLALRFFFPLLPLTLYFFFLCSPWLSTFFSFAPLGSLLLFPLLLSFLCTELFFYLSLPFASFLFVSFALLYSICLQSKIFHFSRGGFQELFTKMFANPNIIPLWKIIYAFFYINKKKKFPSEHFFVLSLFYNRNADYISEFEELSVFFLFFFHFHQNKSKNNNQKIL